MVGAQQPTADNSHTLPEPDRKGKAVDRSHQVSEEQASRRRRIGLTTFVGECFNVEIFSTKIIHSCVVKLLANYPDVDEVDIEAVCELLRIVGLELEAQVEMGPQVQLYFQRMRLIQESPHLSSRIKGMIQVSTCHSYVE